MNAYKLSLTLCLLLQIGLVHSQTLQNTKDPYTKLFTTDGYSKMIRPLANQTEIVHITAVLYIDTIVDFNEQEGSLTTATYLLFEWTDENLRWTALSYGNVTSIYVPQDNVWRPDVTLSNSFEAVKGLGYTLLNVKVTSDGLVNWNPMQLLKSRCNMDITYFPFDTQTCALTFLVWSYESSVVKLIVHKDDKVEIGDSFIPNAQWTLVGSSASEDRNDASVTFSLKPERKSAFYVMNIIIPVVMRSFLNIFVFALPVKSGERASFAVTVFLSMAVFLTIVASELPKNSDVTPCLGVYLIIMSGMNTAIALISVVLIRLAGRDDQENTLEIGNGYRMAYKISSVLTCAGGGCGSNRKVTDVQAMTSNVSLPSYSEDVKTKEQNAVQDNLNWNGVVDALDVLFFILTTVITVISTLVFFIVVVFNPQKVGNEYASLENDLMDIPWDDD